MPNIYNSMPVILICAIISNSKIIYRKFSIKNKYLYEQNKNVILNKIKKSFYERFNIKPEIIIGPYYDAKNYNGMSETFNLSLTIDNNKITYKEFAADNTNLVVGPLLKYNTPKVIKKANKVNRNFETLIFTGQQKQAMFDGWLGIANFLENDPNNIFFIFLSAKGAGRKNVPLAGLINISEVELI